MVRDVEGKKAVTVQGESCPEIFSINTSTILNENWVTCTLLAPLTRDYYDLQWRAGRPACRVHESFMQSAKCESMKAHIPGIHGASNAC